MIVLWWSDGFQEGFQFPPWCWQTLVSLTTTRLITVVGFVSASEKSIILDQDCSKTKGTFSAQQYSLQFDSKLLFVLCLFPKKRTIHIIVYCFIIILIVYFRPHIRKLSAAYKGFANIKSFYFHTSNPRVPAMMFHHSKWKHKYMYSVRI